MASKKTLPRMRSLFTPARDESLETVCPGLRRVNFDLAQVENARVAERDVPRLSQSFPLQT